MKQFNNNNYSYVSKIDTQDQTALPVQAFERGDCLSLYYISFTYALVLQYVECSFSYNYYEYDQDKTVETKRL